MSSSTISVKLMGGLGNQLFQIFTTLAYAMESGHKVIFPYSETLGEKGETIRSTYWNTLFSELLPFLGRTGVPRKMYREPCFEYRAIPPISESFTLFGYFQSPLYFGVIVESPTEQLRGTVKTSSKQFHTGVKSIYEKLDFSKKQQEIADLYSELFPTNKKVISMHFRVGDYKTKQEYHPILPYAYYEKALGVILATVTTHPIRVLYFCEKEDNEWILRERIGPLQVKYPCIEFYKVDDTIPDWHQLFLMSLCDHFIIANSSFSWWGAYLGITLEDRQESRVCYPSVWFGPAMVQTNIQDLFPIDGVWKKIWIKSEGL